MTYTHHHREYQLRPHVAGIPMDEAHKEQIAVAGVAILYFAILCLHGFGAVLRGTTKFFTCEFFSTTGVVHQQTATHAGYAPGHHGTYFYAPSAPM